MSRAWRTLWSALCLTLLAWSPAHAAAQELPHKPIEAGAPRRIAVVIGANAAAPGRRPLRFSHRDAAEMGRVLVELGGFRREDVSVLADPHPDAVLSALDGQLRKLGAVTGQAMLVFYYSGHADASTLYPNGEPLPLAQLRARLTDPRVAVRMGIIDACRGGGWTGAKGLNETQPFDVDLPAALASEGSVLIASSSGLEDAHESELLGGSFFTHHWVAGLRGAADRNSDGQVTLTEAFEYTRALTIRDTALYTAAPQHPSFSMQLKGRSDLSLTTLSAATALLSVDQREGPLELVHLDSGIVVLEIPKGERSLRLAVAPGRYLLRRRLGDKVWAHELRVEAGQTARIDEARLTLVGNQELVIKRNEPRTLTRSTLPRGKQEITAWVGVRHGSGPGLRLGLDEQFQAGVIAPRGLTDRWQWLIPTLAFVYRGGEHAGFEWMPWAGFPGWGMGYTSFAGFHVEAQLGFGIDLRKWLSPHSSIDIGFLATSYLSWLSKDPDDVGVITPTTQDGEEPPPPTYDTPQWIPPDTWRLGPSVGYTHTLADTVTLHLALGLSQTQLYQGEWSNHGLRSSESALALSIGSFQTIGLRTQPLLRVHVRDWVALNADVSVRYRWDTSVFEETYLGGASFVW